VRAEGAAVWQRLGLGMVVPVRERSMESGERGPTLTLGAIRLVVCGERRTAARRVKRRRLGNYIVVDIYIR
jgi:hypothetical protein